MRTILTAGRYIAQLLFFVVSVVSASSLSALSVTDYSGQQVTIDKPARRIIALAPSLAENVYSAGAGHYLVGVMAASDYPEAVKQLPVVGSYSGLNLEVIVSLKPDLIISWASGNSIKTIQKLRALGFPVYVDNGRSLADVAKTLSDIAMLAGTEDAASQVIADFRSGVEQLKHDYRTAQRLSVVYLLSEKPLMTLSQQHVVNELISLCGGQNPYADNIAVAPTISWESFLSEDPQLLVGSADAIAGVSAAQRSAGTWSALQSVQHKQLYVVNNDILVRPTVRLLQGAEQLCESIAAARAYYFSTAIN